MDIDYARHRIQTAQDMPPLSDVVLDLLTLVAAMETTLAGMRQRIEDLEAREGCPGEIA